jgi:hypothetical protein
MKFAPLYDEYVKKSNSDDWEDDCLRFVGFIDIMGFKDMVARYPHEDIKHILLQMNQTRTILLKLLGSKSGIFVNTKDQSDIRVRSFTFSDSVVFITKSDLDIDLLYLSVAMCICQEASIQSGVPTKGAISHGKLTADFEKSIFFGQPIIDAYLLQEQLFYYGVIVDNNAEALLKKFIEEKSSHLDPNHFVRISTPLKNGKVSHFNLRLRNLQEDQLDYLYNSVSGQPRKYVDNTIEIYKEMTNSDKG